MAKQSTIIPVLPLRRKQSQVPTGGVTPLPPTGGQPQQQTPSQQQGPAQSPPAVAVGAEAHVLQDWNKGDNRQDTQPVGTLYLPRKLDDLRIPANPSSSSSVTPTRPSATKAHDDWGKRMQAKVDKLAGYLINYMDQLRFAAYTQRESRNFQARYLRNETRARGATNTRLRPDGTVDVGAIDGHAELGITQGWTFQGIKNASAFLYRNTMEATPDPFITHSQGDNQRENETREKVASDCLRDLNAKGNLKKLFRNLTKEIPRHGNAYLRYEMARRLEYRRDQFGAFHEYVTDMQPVYTIYDPQNVLVTNYSLPEASDQDGVFFIWPNATLTYLSKDEAVFDWADEQGQRVLRVSGKYRGLQRIREQLRYQGMVYGGAGTPGSNVNPMWWYFNSTAVSNEPVFTQVDYEGPMPMAYVVQNRLLDYELAQYLGIDVGFDPDPSNEDQMCEWGIRLQRISHYKFSYLADVRGGAIPFGQQTNTGRYMIQFEPSQHKCPRNSLYVFRYMQDGLDFLGMSVTDLGRKLEDAGDMILNSELWKAYFNAHPSALVDMRVLANRTAQQMARLLHQPRAVIEAQPGADLEKAVQFLKYEPDQFAFERIQQLKTEFQLSTGGNSGQQNDSTGTLGELQIEESKQTLELSDVLVGCGMELARLQSDELEDFIFYSGPAYFYDYANRVSGVSPTELIKAIPDVGAFCEQVKILHPLAVQGDKTVIATLMMRLFQLVGAQGFPDITGFTRAVLQLVQYPDAEGITKQAKSLDPDDEHKMMSNGEWVDPEPYDNQQEHLMKHMQMLKAISGGQPLPYSKDEIQTLSVLLPKHIEDTLSMLATQVNTNFMQQTGSGQVGPPGPTDPNDPNAQNAGGQQMQGQPMNGQPGILNGTGAGGGGLQNNTGEPTRMEMDTNPASTSGMANSITQSTRGVPGSNLTSGAAY